MKRSLLRSTLVLAALGVAAQARAQYPATSGRPYPTSPAVSPYLNLARPGNPAINYYGLVRPQNDFRNSISQLQQQVAVNQASMAAMQDTTLSGTGHPTRFMNYSAYFMNFTGTAGGGHGGAQAQQTPAAGTGIGRPPAHGTGR